VIGTPAALFRDPDRRSVRNAARRYVMARDGLQPWAHGAARSYERHRPERSTLYEVVRANLGSACLLLGQQQLLPAAAAKL
jgi:hypothetical protein